MSKLAKAVRVITVAPFMAILALTLLYCIRPELYISGRHYGAALLFLGILPFLAYPIHALIPKLRATGREGQRNLAILMAVSGYILGILSSIFFNVPGAIAFIYICYFLSGLGILVFNKQLKIKASGHSCGVTGPILLLVYFLGPKALWGLVVLLLACWASLYIKRHTLKQLAWGCLIPLASVLIGIILKNALLSQ